MNLTRCENGHFNSNERYQTAEELNYSLFYVRDVSGMAEKQAVKAYLKNLFKKKDKKL